MIKNFFKWVKIAIIAFSVFFLWNYGPFYFTKEEREYRKNKEEEQNAKEEYIPYVQEIRHAYAKKMKEKFGLVPSGYGGTQRKKVEMLSMDFTTYRRATIEEARGLLLIAMDQLVKAINAHEKIGSFLISKPFSYNRIEICINFKGPNGDYCDGSVTRVYNIDGLGGNRENRNKLFYYLTDPFENNIVKLHNESYDEAMKTFLAPEDFNPYEHETTPLERAVDKIYASFTKEIKEKYNLYCFSIGARMLEKVEEIGGNFCLVKHTSKEDARKLLLAMTKRLIETINLSQELRPYLVKFPLTTDRLKLKIIFRTSDHFSYYDGSMESLTLKNDKITYFKIPPEDRLVRSIPFHEESYLEAKNILENSELLPSLLLTGAK